MAWYEKPTLLASIKKEQDYVFVDESGDIKDLSIIIKKINAGKRVDSRDSNFILTGIYVSSKNLKYIYASLCHFKNKHFGTSNVILHATDIFREKSIPGTSTPKEQFIDELNSLINSYRYRVVATAFNKTEYIRKYNLTNASNSLNIIKAIYKREFLKIEKMLLETGKEACFVLEESSNPKIDKIILDTFVLLRKKKRLVNSKSLYFTKKSASCYPAGIELVDFTSRAIYSFYKNIEFIEAAKKVYQSSFNHNPYLEFFDKKIK